MAEEDEHIHENEPENEQKIVESATEMKPKNIPFWGENPNVLLNLSYISEFFPSSEMTYNQKLNAISRMILVLTIGMFLIMRTSRSILFGLISLGAIYLVHYYHDLEKKKEKKKLDAFTGLGGQTRDNSPALSVLDNADKLLVSPVEVFDQPKAENPFSNVLVTDINGNPMKKPAPPAYNDQVNKNILAAAKEAVLNANPGNPDISDKLFKDLGEQMSFEQSMRQFYSNPATTTPDDQKAFAEFCYGGMISCAEGNKFACARNAAAMRHTFI